MQIPNKDELMKKLFLFCLLAIFVNLADAQPVTKEKAIKKLSPANTPAKSVPVGSSFLNGVFSAPVGSALLLQNNGKQDLSLTAVKEDGKNFSTGSFRFSAPLLDSSIYKVTCKKAPAGQTCFIY